MSLRRRVRELEQEIATLHEIVDAEIERDQAAAVDRQVRWDNERMRHRCHDQLPNCPPRCPYDQDKPPRDFS